MDTLPDSETCLRPIAKAFELITGNRPSPPTIWRWKTQGCKGIPLPFVQVGGIPMISLSDGRQWLADVTLAAQQRFSKPLTPPLKPSRSRANAAAQRLADEVR